MDSSSRALSVTEVTRKIKVLLENSFRKIIVKGEISNFKQVSSGHIYFTVKDGGAELKCVMFRSYNQYLKFKLENGMDVILSGNLTVYEVRGNYQLLVQNVEPAGLGTLYLAFEALKKQLSAEGLFADSRKKHLPLLPQTIGVITSRTGAALQDILKILGRRSPFAEIIIRESLVQGESAVNDLVSALMDMQQQNRADVIIIGRGGGSIEDLWSFNAEKVVRAIADCKIPIISAVGHETDFTLSDLAADLRAPTPSAAAELVCLSSRELLEKSFNSQLLLKQMIVRKLETAWQKLDNLEGRITSRQPLLILERYRERLNTCNRHLRQSMNHYLTLFNSGLQGIENELKALDPHKILERGYSLAFKNDGSIIRAESNLKRGEDFILRTGQGSLLARKKKSIDYLDNKL